MSFYQKESKEVLTTVFRSILGAILWLCLTRLDLIADCIHLQCEVTAPLVKHLRSSNKLVERAKKLRDSCGLWYPRLGYGGARLRPPTRLLSFHDFSLPSKERKYGFEGVISLLTYDAFAADSNKLGDDVKLSKQQCQKYFGGPGHVMSCVSRKSKRVASSSEHGESTAGQASMEIAHSILLRYTEVMSGRLYTL